MAKYPYSDIIKNLTAIYFSGGDTIKSKSGKKYQFNINEKLNGLLFECMLNCNLVKAGDSVTLDYDNYFIPTEKPDATYSYKKVSFPDLG